MSTLIKPLEIAAEYCKAKGIRSGLTGVQHAAILTRVAAEHFSAMAEPGDPQPAELAALMKSFMEVSNGSALRQKLEKAGVLSQGGKADAIDLEAML